MNPRLTDRRLAGLTWRRRYHGAASALLHLRLTVQALGLPDDEVPEQLPPTDLRAFLDRLMDEVERFVDRELRYWSAVGPEVRRWRIAGLFPLLELFDSTNELSFEGVPGPVTARWRTLSRRLVRLKALVVRYAILN